MYLKEPRLPVVSHITKLESIVINHYVLRSSLTNQPDSVVAYILTLSNTV